MFANYIFQVQLLSEPEAGPQGSIMILLDSSTRSASGS